MSQEVKVVQLVLPESMTPVPAAAPAQGSSWWIAAVVGAVVIANAVLVWWRVKGRDPLKRAFAEVAASARLSRAERRRVAELAGAQRAPVAMLLCESALEESTDDSLVVNVREKLKRARL